MSEADEILAAATPHIESATVLLRGDLAAEHDRLEEELGAALAEDERLNQPNRAPKIAAQIAELEEEIRAAEKTFTFQTIENGKRGWSDLKAEHAPTDEQVKKYPRLDVNPDTFPYEAMARTLVSPKGFTADKIRELETKCREGDWDRLWAACLAASMGSRRPGESEAASAVLRRMRPSSEQPSASVSEDQSSLAE